MIKSIVDKKLAEFKEKSGEKSNSEIPTPARETIINLFEGTLINADDSETEASKAQKCYADVRLALKKVNDTPNTNKLEVLQNKLKDNLEDLRDSAKREDVLDAMLSDLGLSTEELDNIKYCFNERENYSATFNDVLNRAIQERTKS